MTVANDFHRIGIFVKRDSGHPSGRKIKITAHEIPGEMWCREGENYEDLATKWISAMMGWPEHLIDAYNVNTCSGPV